MKKTILTCLFLFLFISVSAQTVRVEHEVTIGKEFTSSKAIIGKAYQLITIILSLIRMEER